MILIRVHFPAVYKVSIEGDKLVVKNWWFSDFESKINEVLSDHTSEVQKEVGFESLRQVTMNGSGDVIVVGITSSRATVLHNDLSGVKCYYDINTYSPWGVKIDKAETVFLGNFAHEKERANENTLDMIGPFGVTMLRDASDPSSAKLLTVPTGGSEVKLANGFPL